MQQGNKLRHQIVLDNNSSKYDWKKALLRFEGKNDVADIGQNAQATDQQNGIQ